MLDTKSLTLSETLDLLVAVETRINILAYRIGIGSYKDSETRGIVIDEYYRLYELYRELILSSGPRFEFSSYSLGEPARIGLRVWG